MRKHRISSHAKRLAQGVGEMVTKLESSQMQMNLSFIKLFSNMSVLTKLDDFLLLLNGDSLSISSEMRKTAPVEKQKTGDALDFPYRAVILSPSSNTILLFIEGKTIIENFYMSVFFVFSRQERTQAQLLRDEQDEAYYESVRADQEKVRRYSFSCLLMASITCKLLVNLFIMLFVRPLFIYN